MSSLQPSHRPRSPGRTQLRWAPSHQEDPALPETMRVPCDSHHNSMRQLASSLFSDGHIEAWGAAPNSEQWACLVCLRCGRSCWHTLWWGHQSQEQRFTRVERNPGSTVSFKTSWLCTHRAVCSRKILFTRARCCVSFKNAVAAVLLFNSFRILIKHKWNNQTAKLGGNSKAGQSKPPTCMRKPRFRGGASQSLLMPLGSRCFLLATRHMCPMFSTSAKPLAGLPSGKCWAASFPGAQPHGQCGPRGSSWLSTLRLPWPPEHRPRETCSRPQGH